MEIMDPNSRSGDRPKSLTPQEIPFVGWSRAACEYRQQAARFAPSGSVRPLIIGEPGVGRKTMARAWQVATGRGAESRIEDLDWRSVGLPTCFIGVTTFRPPKGRYCVLLGRGARGEVPGPGPGSDTDGLRLEDEIMQLFGLPLFMPPISSGREIDVLAFLDYWNRARSPYVGIRYRKISLALLRRLALMGPWPANLEGVYRHLRMLNHLNRPAASDGDALATMLELEILRERDGSAELHHQSTEPAVGRTGEGPAKPGSEEGEILFDELPDLAVRIFLWCCQHEPPEEGGPGLAGAGQSPGRLPVSLGSFVNGLTATEFLGLDEEKFVRDHVIPGIPVALAARSDCFAVLMDRVQNGFTFGTTFKALQEGLRIDPVRVEARLGRPADASRTRWSAASYGDAAAEGAAPVAPSDKPSGWTANRFCIEEDTFHIVYWQPGGRVEQGRFGLKGNLGLAYYRLLVRDPERGYSAGMIEREFAGENEIEESTQGMAYEIGAGTRAGFDAVLDAEGKQRFYARLATNDRE